MQWRGFAYTEQLLIVSTKDHKLFLPVYYPSSQNVDVIISLKQ